MSHYAYELKKATTHLNKADFSDVLAKIKEEVKKDVWKGYGWQKAVLSANKLEDIANCFDIQLTAAENDYYRPVINNVYVSRFFPELIRISAPYMTDGSIVVDDEFSTVTVSFEGGKAKIWYD